MEFKTYAKAWGWTASALAVGVLVVVVASIVALVDGRKPPPPSQWPLPPRA